MIVNSALRSQTNKFPSRDDFFVPDQRPEVVSLDRRGGLSIALPLAMPVTKRLVARIAVLALSALCGAAAVARANSIGPNCGTCQGSIYTLTNLGQIADINTSDGVADTWRISLSVDTSTYTGGGQRIDEVAVKVSNAVDRAKLISAPGGVAVWEQLEAGGLNANGCNGSGSGFDCADWKLGSTSGAFIPGPLLTWVFDIDVNGALFTGANMASLKARYVDARDQKVGALVSENITLGTPLTPVPEPGSLILLGTGVSYLVARRRARPRVSTE
jgi:PEP-CTERM motif